MHLLLGLVAARYASAQPMHDTHAAALVRQLAQDARRRALELGTGLAAGNPAAARQATRTLSQLEALLRPTTLRFEPWPLTLEVNALSARAQHQLEEIRPALGMPKRAYGAIESALAGAQADASAGRAQEAGFALVSAYALYASGPGQRLQGENPQLDEEITHELLGGGGSLAGSSIQLSPSGVRHVTAAVRSELGLAAQTLDEVQISRTTIVVNGAIIVFREGLEAVLIIAAITASFVGAKSHLRRPVLIGALAGLLATLLTWVVAQMLLHLLGNGGLKLQAVTGLLAIGVLLLVTNWFFHRVYWSEWIARFNRRRRRLERWDGLGFVSGQVIGFMLLGLSSVYREGLETVLFLQALQTSAGTGATALGAGIGLAATLVVGTITFKLQRKLPFKRMLILTGVLIALVLAVMVGTTVHNLQGIGWLPMTPTAFNVPLAWSTWIGVYPTWEGIMAQLGALAFVLGSFFEAREIQVKRPQRRTRSSEGLIPASAPRA
jgi:high-affinity iron transporter